MKIPVAVFGLVLEITFVVYCMYMIYLLDIRDPFPQDWAFPNMLIGVAILGFGFFVISGRHQPAGGGRHDRGIELLLKSDLGSASLQPDGGEGERSTGARAKTRTALAD